MQNCNHTLAEVNRFKGLVTTGHYFDLPLDYSKPDGETVKVYAREVVAPSKEGKGLPWLVFLQGGPGGASPRPTSSSGWLKRALDEFRVLLLDQRGTGLSSPVNHQSLPLRGDAHAQADYLTHFRADNIVRDAEAIRSGLAGDEPWSALGQSYGGFCLSTYLSLAPEGLREGYFTGGIPTLTRSADDVYRAEYPRCSYRTKCYYDQFPQDIERVREIVDYLATHDVQLPMTGRLTPRRFQMMGMGFGMSGGYENVHYLVETAFIEGQNGRELNHNFLAACESTGFAGNPLYVVLQEIIYGQGSATNWAAERVRAEYPEFEISDGQPVQFTGEMMFPWMFDENPYLQQMKGAADILAAYEDWPMLYDVERLRTNKVPCAAAVYYYDLYVDRVQSEESANNIGNLKLWVTSEYEHDGIRADGERVLDRLIKMVRNEI